MKSDLTWQATAAANILEARRKRGRISSKKSRSGCANCKKRRIKCDEARPNCTKCISSGRKCDGYVDSAKPGFRKNTNSLIGVRLSQSLGLKEVDRRTFDYFLKWTAPRIAGIGLLDREFWCGQVLQLSQAEPLVLDALLSISTLYEHPQFMKSFSAQSLGEHEVCVPKHSIGVCCSPHSQNVVHRSYRKPDLPAMDPYHVDALKLYNRAIQRFAEKMAAGEATLLFALLSCVLFICIELIRDHLHGALDLTTKGIRLLRHIESSNPDCNDAFFQSIRHMLVRLCVFIGGYGFPPPLRLPPELLAIPPVYPAATFDDAADARTTLFAIVADSQSFSLDAVDFNGLGRTEHVSSETSYDENVLPQRETGLDTSGLRETQSVSAEKKFSAIPQEIEITPSRIFNHAQSALINRQAQLEARLSQWYTAFQLLNAIDQTTTSILLIHYHVSYVVIQTRLSPYQSEYDRHTYHFEEIVRLAEICIQDKTEHTTFTFDAGIIPSLYFTGTKCRIPSLRRKALELINKAPRKECLWGARPTAEIVARIISIEEEDMSAAMSSPSSQGIHSTFFPDSRLLPPEASRIHTLEITRDEAAGRTNVRVTRYSFDMDRRRVPSVLEYPI